MRPQFTYDNKGNAIGVFLPIEDWNKIKDRIPSTDELPQWQKDILDHRMSLIKQNPQKVQPLDDFLAEMEKEANAEI